MYRLTHLFFALFLCGPALSQNLLFKQIEAMISSGKAPSQVMPLTYVTNDVQARDFNLEGLAKGTVLELNPGDIETLYKDRPDFILMTIPKTDRSQVILALKRQAIFTKDFSVYSSSNPDVSFDYEPGIHYRGVMDGDPNSIAAVSIYHNRLMGLVSTPEGNYNLGPIQGDPEQRHVLYNDRDLEAHFNFTCETEDDGIGYTLEQLAEPANTRDVGDCIRMYIEINDDIVTAQGGVAPATDYITAIFNQSIVLYANEQISAEISEIKAWDTPSPYNGSGSGSMLAAFKQGTEFVNGDLGHLVSFDSLYGGVTTTLAGICSAYPDNAKCFSGIRMTYQAVPVFSWPVLVVTHEMGHILGSHHTHACVWNGNNTAIDGCSGNTEGGCPLPGLPPNGGTVMSYCYPSNGSYYDFTQGFGPQPGAVIRNTVNSAGNCLTPAGQPTAYCEGNGSNSSNDYIQKVVLGSINNTSGNNGGYADFTNQSNTLVAGSTYTLTLSPKPQNGGRKEYWRAWIDYNHDFDWYDDAEIIGSGYSNGIVNIVFTVPANSPGVTTRLRISMRYDRYSNFCGTYANGEVEDYTVVITPGTPSCSDGIQNQGETGIDCGGPCSACPTCSDGIQNQGETGIDCGGPCAACPQGESTILLGAYFESGWDSWLDGGQDAGRVSSTNAYEGSYCIKLADNSGVESAMTSPVFDLSTAVGVSISFHFLANSMETGEDFWVLYNNGSGNWQNIATLTSGSTFNNLTFYQSTIMVPGFVPTAAGSFRVQCDAGDNNDQVFIDAVIITRLNGSELFETQFAILETPRQGFGTPDPALPPRLVVYPNPTKDMLTLSFPGEIRSMRLMSLDGRELSLPASDLEDRQVDLSSLVGGIYLLQIVDDRNRPHMAKVIKQ